MLHQVVHIFTIELWSNITRLKLLFGLRDWQLKMNPRLREGKYITWGIREVKNKTWILTTFRVCTPAVTAVIQSRKIKFLARLHFFTAVGSTLLTTLIPLRDPISPLSPVLTTRKAYSIFGNCLKFPSHGWNVSQVRTSAPLLLSAAAKSVDGRMRGQVTGA
jgi:hypothetical protein